MARICSNRSLWTDLFGRRLTAGLVRIHLLIALAQNGHSSSGKDACVKSTCSLLSATSDISHIDCAANSAIAAISAQNESLFLAHLDSIVCCKELSVLGTTAEESSFVMANGYQRCPEGQVVTGITRSRSPAGFSCRQLKSTLPVHPCAFVNSTVASDTNSNKLSCPEKTAVVGFMTGFNADSDQWEIESLHCCYLFPTQNSKTLNDKLTKVAGMLQLGKHPVSREAVMKVADAFAFHSNWTFCDKSAVEKLLVITDKVTKVLSKDLWKARSRVSAAEIGSKFMRALERYTQNFFITSYQDKVEVQNKLSSILLVPGRNINLSNPLIEAVKRSGFQPSLRAVPQNETALYGNDNVISRLWLPHNLTTRGQPVCNGSSVEKFILSAEVFLKSTLFDYWSLMDYGIVINSPVVAVYTGKSAALTPDQTVTIELYQHSNNSSPLCAWWDFQRNDGQGGWTTDGCHLSKKKPTLRQSVVCECNRFAHYSLLKLTNSTDSNAINATKSRFDEPNDPYFASLVLVCWLGVVLFVVCFRQFWHDFRIKVVTQLCTALTGATLCVAMTSMKLIYEEDTACQATALCLHYFSLAFFCWMLVEGLHMYSLIVVVYMEEIEKPFKKAFIFSWGVPFAIVFITSIAHGFSLDAYKRPMARAPCCFLGRTSFFISMLVPCSLVLVVNIFIFFLVVHQIYQKNGTEPTGSRNVSQASAARGRVSRQIIRTLLLAILLGICWIPVFISLATFAASPLSAFFTIVACLSSFSLIIFEILMRKDVRSAIFHQVKQKHKQRSDSVRRSAGNMLELSSTGQENTQQDSLSRVIFNTNINCPSINVI